MTTFRIFGHVIDGKTHLGVAGLRVEAWDKDLICNDLVGSTITDEQGNFRIEFDESYFQELFHDRRPDLFFKVFRENNLIKSTEDSVLWNIESGATQIVIEIPGMDAIAGYCLRVVVKFQDYVKLPYEDDIAAHIRRLQLGSYELLEKEFPGITFKRLYASVEPQRIRTLVDQASELDPTYRPPNLLGYFVVDCPPGIDPDALAKVLSSWKNVENAYVEGGPTPPPAVNAIDDPRSVNQGYLDPAPDGIDARYAWTFLGGDGTGIQFVDLERGWTLNHEDLIAAGITLISGVNQDYFGHGTSVLGEVVAVDNTLGDVGIATHATARVVSQWRTTTTYNTAEAILSAIATLNFGDVLLLEAQTNAFGFSLVPVEIEPAVFDIIRLGTALGIVIVEAAGNGGNDLDTVTGAGGGQVLNRNNTTDFKDSGAIMVGAASSTSPHVRLGFSNYGSRIDCYAWGQGIDTTGDGWTGNLTNSYTTSFGGTSGASPIVTGAALILQGMAQESLLYRFSPRQLRAILSNPATGTPSNNPPVDRIGVMPNLRAIVDSVLNVASDVYIRDFVGDTGDPHIGSISASPDIILLPAAVASPQVSFGEGSGTENSNTLGFEAEVGQDNYLYVRVRNRGGVAATNVVATVYWSPVATLVTPDLWTLVGSVTIPNVPSGNLLTVSNAITWLKDSIPGTGHYCFVGLIGSASEPAPEPAAFLDWDNFRLFIRNNNDVTWRNFNVVDNEPDPPAGDPPNYVALPFLVPGTPDRARRMRLEVVARLPKGAKVLLEAPLHLIDAMQERSPFVKLEEKSRVAWIPINPHGSRLLGEVLFPAKSRNKLRLLVYIPEELRKNEYEVFVRQLYQNEEVGRVTWRLAPRNRQKQSN